MLTMISGLVIAVAAAGDQWSRQSPSPTFVNLKSAEFLDRDNGWVAGDFTDKGGIWRTHDGGATWETLFQNWEYKMEEVEMFDLEHGIAVGDRLYTTSNGWRSWSTAPLPEEPAGEANTVAGTSLQFVSSTRGWLGTRPSFARTFLYRTDDGGETWDHLGTFNLDSWSFADANVGWATRLDSALQRTSDGGDSWTDVPEPPVVHESLHVAQAFSVDEVVVVAFHGAGSFSTHHTWDGGQTWSSSAPGSPRFPVFHDSMIGYGAFHFGPMAKTTDGGVTWTQQGDGTYLHEYVKDVAVIDAQTALATCEYGYIIGTEDGENWEQLSNGSGQQLNYVEFHDDATHGWATGFGDTIMHTDDGGWTWRLQVLPTVPWPFSYGIPSDIRIWSEDHVYIHAGNAILTTTDGGDNWDVRGPFEGWPSGHIFFLTPEIGFLHNYGSFSKTTNGGQTWNTISTGINTTVKDVVVDLYFFDELHGWVVGQVDRVFRTRDGGLTWERPPGIPTERVYRRTRFVTPDIGWLVGDDGRVLRTTDGGDTWEDQTQPGTFDENLYSLAVTSENEAWICSRDDVLGAYLRRTTDAGQTWEYAYTGPGVTDLEFGYTLGIAVVGDKVWTVGTDGIVRHNGTRCDADLTLDGVLDIFDVLDFLGRFDAGSPDADWNDDAIIDIFDVLAYLADFDAGC